MNSTVSHRKPINETLVSVVLPLYNEAAVLERLRSSIRQTLENLGCRYEIVFVNDGSTDDSARILDDMARHDSKIRVLHLSRNFGHQAAVQAGLQHARGDAVVVMDSDLQDNPAWIPEFLKKWQEGFDVVYAIRTNRKEGWLKRLLFYAFYRVLHWISGIEIPKDAGNFGLVDRTVAQRIADIPDRDRYYSGLRCWVGFRQIGILVERDARYDDNPRVSIRQLFGLAKAAIFSFSSFPLLMFYGISLVSLFVCFTFSVFTLYHKIFTGLAVPGWTSITITASFFGTLNALGIGILGEYVIRIYDQVRMRPQFIVSRKVNFEETTALAPEVLLKWLADHWSEDSEPVLIGDTCEAEQI